MTERPLTDPAERAPAAALLIGLLPLLLLIALVIRASSPGSPLVHCDVVGLHGEPFNVLAFRVSQTPGVSHGGSLTRGVQP